MKVNVLALLETETWEYTKRKFNPSICRRCDSIHECELCSYWWGQKHGETATGNRKLFFGEGIQLTVESSEYYFNFLSISAAFRY